MSKNLFSKIISNHLVYGEMKAGEEIAIKIDQTLTQDTTGTIVCLAFETLGIPKVRTKVSVSYVDHNILQIGYENADDHLFLQTFAQKYGIYYSRVGNGICHKVHYERFAVPGETLLGADSHTPTSSALGMVAIGAGGMSVAMAMAGEPFYMKMPEVINVVLKGKLSPGVAAKDIILELLRRLTVKGGIGKVIEYSGPGVNTLSVPERVTITNMGAELGLTTSLFPSDEMTLRFLQAQGREKDWIELKADQDVKYDEQMEIDLGILEPLVAKPHMPDRVAKAGELGDVHVDQVFIGSCTNSSYSDLAKAAAILEGKLVHKDVSLAVAPGSRQVLEMICRDGLLEKFISAGARILECACGPCVGVGQSPCSGGVSVRTSNRNFKGRSGTADAEVYLASPEVAAATALNGKITDPRTLAEIESLQNIREPQAYIVDDRMIIAPTKDPDSIQVRRGPNIKPLPIRGKLQNEILCPVLLKVGDNITTDDIIPASPEILRLRPNIPEISKYAFCQLRPGFYQRAEAGRHSLIVGGENYGQGSAREHAALVPMYLGVQAIIAKSFARIHHENLINFGIIPLVFTREADYNTIEENDLIEITDIIRQVKHKTVSVYNRTKDYRFDSVVNITEKQMNILLEGGLLNYKRKQLIL